MAEYIDGSWKSFTFRMVQPSDFPSILAHLRANFYMDEPLNVHIGYDGKSEEDVTFMDSFVMNSLEKHYPLSFMAIEKATGKIAGVRLINEVNKDDPPPPVDMRVEVSQRRFSPVVGVVFHLSDEAKIFERYHSISRYAEFFLVSVDREFRGCGLATEIYDRAFRMLTSLQFPLIKCVFSSPHTQRIARKRDFRELAQVRISEWTENGRRSFPNATEDELVIVMVKELMNS